MNVEIFKIEIIKKMKESEEGAIKLVDNVSQAVVKVLDEIIDSCFGSFPDLSAQIKLSAKDQLAGLRTQTVEQIEKMLRVEGNFIYQRKSFYEVILARIADQES